MNPYNGVEFFSFFQVLFSRILQFIGHGFSLEEIHTDEVQLLVLSAVSISSAIVGTFLVLKRMAMLANALSHTILLGIVLAYFFLKPTSIESPLPLSSMLIAALLMGWLTGFLSDCLTKGAKLSEDASIGLVFTSLFAIGVILVTVLTRNAHIGTEVVMGNVDGLNFEDAILVWSILGIKLILLLLFFKEFQATAFDPQYAVALGISVPFFNLLLMTQSAATTIGAFRAVGVLMVLSLMTGPVLAARFFVKTLKPLLILASIFGLLASLFGVALSRHIFTAYDTPLSTGGVVVALVVVEFAIPATYFLIKRLKLTEKAISC